MKGLNSAYTRTLLSTAILATLPATAALAQSPLALEEVLVVATKRESSLQDVAVAVSALSESLLEDNQIDRSEELTNLVASLNVQAGNNPRSSSFNIRGIGTQSFSSGVEPSVSTVVGGVVMGRSGMAFAQLPDVQRVEVLRGPQGTLFGKNSSGGLIHIITKDPSGEFEGQVGASVVENDEYRVHGTVSAPITDRVAFRLTGSYIDDGGYIKNIYDGEDYNTREDTMFRGKISWNASPKLFFKYTVDWSEAENKGAVLPVRELFDPDALGPGGVTVSEMLAPVVPSDENMTINTTTSQIVQNTTESLGHAVDIEWDIGDHTITSITALREWESENSAGIGYLPVDPFGLAQTGLSDQEQFTQELRLTSPDAQFMTYVVGLYYFDQSVDRHFDRVLERFNSITATDFTVDTTNYAAFGEVVFNVSDTVRLIAGGRYTDDEIEYDYARTGGGNPIDPPVADSTSETDFSGKFAAQWDFSDSGMAYLSFSQGYKGPAYSLAANTDVHTVEAVDPETADAWELGIKSSLLDGGMTLNLALFHTNYQDFQSESFVDNGQDDGTGEFRLANAGEVTTQGLEADLSWHATQNLLINGSLAYIDAKIDDYKNGPCTFGQAEALTPPSCGGPQDGGTSSQDLSGGDLPHSPDLRVTLNANYLIPLESMPFDLVLKGNYRWQDEVLYEMAQDEGSIQDSYGILDLALSLEDNEERYTVTAYVKNVADEFYVSRISSAHPISLPGGGYVHQVPKFAERTFGVDFRYRW